MDEIPTPRCDEHELLMESEDFDVELAKTKTFAKQIERELTIATKTIADRDVAIANLNAILDQWEQQCGK
jgi:hypothetical protein